MTGWIIYNGALRIKKVEILALDLVERAKKVGINFIPVKNNEIIPMIDDNGELTIKGLDKLKEPEFIIFWDKDVLLAKHLEDMGYMLFNSSRAIEICDNKSLMHIELAKNKLRVPKTIISPYVYQNQKLSDQYFDRVIEELGKSIILKESYGSFGMQVYKLEGKEELRNKIMELGRKSFVIQEDIKESHGRDIRVNIIGDRIIGAMERISEGDFRANITLGATARPIELTKEQADLSLKAHRTLELDFSGVDLLYDKNRNPILCEVNSNVNYISFEKTTGISFGDKILDYIRGRLEC